MTDPAHGRIRRDIRSPCVVLCLAALSVSVVPGCGDSPPPTTPIRGRVTYNGEPVTDGRISLLPVGATLGPTVTGEIVDGGYDIAKENGPTFGSYRVEIEGFRKTGRTMRNLASPERTTANPPMVEEKEPYLPPKFNLESQLSAEITAETRELNFDLKN